MESDSHVEQQVFQETLNSINEQAKNSSGQHYDACVICLERITERAVAVPCNHLNFDFVCLVNWLEQRSTCPLCNVEIKQVDYDWRGPDDSQTYFVKRESGKSSEQPPLLRGRGFGGRGQPSPQRRFARRNRPRNLVRRVLSADDVLQRRRQVYVHRTYSMYVGSNRLSCFRDFMPDTFRTSEVLQSRARKWIRRELQVFDFLNAAPHRDGRSNDRRASNAEFLLEYIMAILRTVDTKDAAGHAEQMLQEFLGIEHARLFLHELVAWLRSPYTSLEDWDRHVQYPEIPVAASASTSKRKEKGRNDASSMIYEM